MQCRNCGAEIAEKALICYRCGTATTDAKYAPAPLPRTGSRASLVATVVALVLIVGVGLAIGRASDISSTSRGTIWAITAVAVVIVALRAYARRR